MATWLAEIGLYDGLGGDDIFWWAAGLLTVITLVTVLIKPARTIRRFFHRIGAFLGDWFGEPADLARQVAGIDARITELHKQSATRETQTQIADKLDDVLDNRDND